MQVTGLRKTFDGIVALADGRFRLEPGTVHALCGGNGAGKSTFLKIVMGIQSRDAGEIRIDDVPVTFNHPSEALAAGIAIIEQELSPILDMTVLENIFLGREPTGRFGRVDFKAMADEAGRLLEQLDFAIDPRAPMRSLSIGHVQLVEIAKALSHNARIIIMDEPSSALGESDVSHLYAAIRRLRAQGKGIIYVSHRLTEIFELADHYTVFRDGRFVETGELATIDRSRLINLIVGREIQDEYAKTNTPRANVRLAVSNLTRPGKLRDISFELREGEILGFYGLLGAGRTEMLDCLFGLARDWQGDVVIDGEAQRIASPRAAMRAGLALVTEDRKEAGLVLTDTVRTNLSLAVLPRLSPTGVIDRRREAAWSAETIGRFQIKTSSDQLPVGSLSGGNQQKVVIGRFDMTKPKIFLFDEPTRGVDVGAKREIYGIISDFAESGGSVIMVSGEAEELLGMCDRIAVMRSGTIVRILARADATQDLLLGLAA
jgi:putative xylitol transport system ATP-binding protein